MEWRVAPEHPSHGPHHDKFLADGGDDSCHATSNHENDAGDDALDESTAVCTMYHNRPHCLQPAQLIPIPH